MRIMGLGGPRPSGTLFRTAVVCGVLAGLGTWGLASPAGAAGGTVWTVSRSFPAPLQIVAVRCVTPTVCEAVGSNLIGEAVAVGTDDGGKVWNPQTLPAMLGSSFLLGLSCPTQLVCLAVGEQDSGPLVVATGDGGHTWTTQTAPAGIGALSAVSCATTTICQAVGQEGSQANLMGTTNGGQNWTLEPVADSGTFAGVSCPSPSTCVAVGDNSNGGGGSAYRTSDGGTIWTPEVVYSAGEGMTAVSCVSLEVCYAVAEDGVIDMSADGGQTWALNIGAANAQLYGVACSSARHCVASGRDGQGRGVLFELNRGQWTGVEVPNLYQVDSVSCPSTTMCEATGISFPAAGSFVTSTDGGSTWSDQPSPLRLQMDDLDAVACPSGTTCHAVASGGVIATTASGAATWQLTEAPGVRAADEISCATTTVCEVAGNQTNNSDVLARTTDGGRTWASQPVPSGVTSLNGVACPSATSCVVLGEESSSATPSVAMLTDDGGRTWSVDPLPAGMVGDAVACPSVTVCVATGSWRSDSQGTGAIARSNNGGKTWTVQATDMDTGAGVSCPSVAACVVVGGFTTSSTTNGGRSWHVDFLPVQLGGVSCSTMKSCEMISDTTRDDPVVFNSTDAGTSWTSQPLPSQTERLQGIACASAILCVAVGQNTQGGALIINIG
jgi:photosystem II stability/assembly factor-like uncharacterized protein